MWTANRKPGADIPRRAALLAIFALLCAAGCVRRYEPGRVPAGPPERKPATAAQAPKAPDERAVRGLSGPVRRVFAKSYHLALDGSGNLELFLSSVTTFDGNGGFVSEDFYDAKGARTARNVAARDGAGRLSGLEYRSSTGALESRAAYDYDTSGRLAKESYLSADGAPRGEAVYEYGPEGRLSKRSTRTSYQDGSTRTTEVSYLYDADGRLVEETYREPDRGDVDLRIEHTYRNGVRIRSSDYQRGRWLEYLTFYEHDPRGNIAREASYQIPESEYGDSFGTATSEETLPRSFLVSVTTTEYEYYGGPQP